MANNQNALALGLLAALALPLFFRGSGQSSPASESDKDAPNGEGRDNRESGPDGSSRSGPPLPGKRPTKTSGTVPPLPLPRPEQMAQMAMSLFAPGNFEPSDQAAPPNPRMSAQTDEGQVSPAAAPPAPMPPGSPAMPQVGTSRARTFSGSQDPIAVATAGLAKQLGVMESGNPDPRGAPPQAQPQGMTPEQVERFLFNSGTPQGVPAPAPAPQTAMDTGANPFAEMDDATLANITGGAALQPHSQALWSAAVDERIRRIREGSPFQ